METINKKPVSEINKEEALDYVHENKHRYISSSPELNERQFDCLIEIMEDDNFNLKDLPSYGISDQQLGLK